MIQSYNINNFNKDNLVGDYIQNGFVLIEDIISNQEKDEIKEELKKINRGDYGCNGIEPIEKSLSDESLLSRYMYVGHPHVFSKVIHKYIAHENLTKILDHLVGANVPFGIEVTNACRLCLLVKNQVVMGHPGIRTNIPSQQEIDH